MPFCIDCGKKQGRLNPGSLCKNCNNSKSLTTHDGVDGMNSYYTDYQLQSSQINNALSNNCNFNTSLSDSLSWNANSFTPTYVTPLSMMTPSHDIRNNDVVNNQTTFTGLNGIASSNNAVKGVNSDHVNAALPPISVSQLVDIINTSINPVKTELRELRTLVINRKLHIHLRE